MLRPGRLLTAGVVTLLVYTVFYAEPRTGPGAADFDPAAVARYEAAAWQAARARNELAVIINCTLYQRELHRMSWFRSAESAFPMARAIQQFLLMIDRFERVRPQLEEVASIERQWKEASFEPPRVARAQLNWMIMTRDATRPGNLRQAVSNMDEDLSLRFGLQPGYASGAASERTQAYQLILGRGADPDWEAVTAMLARAYESLRTTLAARSTSVVY